MSKESKGFVYFIGSDRAKIVKIGYTEKDPNRRLKALQTGCPVKVGLIAYIDGSRETELRLHKTFSPVAMHGEWFRIEGKLEHFLWYLEGYAEHNGPYLDGDDFDVAIYDNVLSKGTPHPSIGSQEWLASAIDSYWEHLL